MWNAKLNVFNRSTWILFSRLTYSLPSTNSTSSSTISGTLQVSFSFFSAFSWAFGIKICMAQCWRLNWQFYWDVRIPLNGKCWKVNDSSTLLRCSKVYAHYVFIVINNSTNIFRKSIFYISIVFLFLNIIISKLLFVKVYQNIMKLCYLTAFLETSILEPVTHMKIKILMQ